MLYFKNRCKIITFLGNTYYLFLREYVPKVRFFTKTFTYVKKKMYFCIRND